MSGFFVERKIMLFQCQGRKKNGKKCGSSVLYKCKYCGFIGCRVQGCSNQQFKGHTCVICGKTNTPLKKYNAPIK